jgi:hypothetical protein
MLAKIDETPLTAFSSVTKSAGVKLRTMLKWGGSGRAPAGASGTEGGSGSWGEEVTCWQPSAKRVTSE